MTTEVLLVLGADPAARRAVQTHANGERRRVHLAPAEEGLEAVVRVQPQVVIIDANHGALELLDVLRSRGVEAYAILLDGAQNLEMHLEARRRGAFDVLDAPLDPEALRDTVNAAFRARAIRSKAAVISPPVPANTRKDGIVGESAATLTLRRWISTCARSRASVLVRGETGTGKELVARALHAYSSTAREPFVAVNVTTLSGNLIESELFGHVKGAFTGAVTGKKGAFELAGRGVIVLDEIGSASMDLQGKLLRVLQEDEFWPVGAEEPRRSEARVIAVTNEDLERRVDENRFRKDFYYRLKVLEIATTPLRERKADIPALVQHFVWKAAAADGYEGPFWLSPEAEGALLAHAWPGNVRELENLIQAALTRQRGGVILAEDLGIPAIAARIDVRGERGDAMEASAVQESAPPGKDAPEGGASGGGAETLEEMERAHIVDTLRECRANVAAAARRLGLKRPTLYDRMRRLGISREDFDPPNKEEP